MRTVRSLMKNELKQCKTNEDIEGCVEVIRSNSEYNAVGFIRLKERAKEGFRLPFKNNLEVVTTMKNNGVWQHDYNNNRRPQ